MLGQLFRTLLPVLSMESSVVELQEAYKEAATYVDKLLVSEKNEIKTAAKLCLCHMIYESRESGAIPAGKLKELLSQGAKIEAAREALIKKANSYLRLKAHLFFNPLPERLGSLHGEDLKYIYYLHVPEQTNGWTCGLWAVYNSHALYRLRKAKKSLSNVAITDNAKSLYADLKEHIAKTNELLGSHEGITPGNIPPLEAIVEFKKAVDLVQGTELANNIHFIVYLPGKDRVAREDKPTFSEFDPAVLAKLGCRRLEDAENIVMDTDDMARKFMEDFREHGMVNFLCYLYEPDPHWINGSILEVEGYKPIMIILDSYNFEITADSDAAKVISFLYEKMLQPLRVASPEIE